LTVTHEKKVRTSDKRYWILMDFIFNELLGIGGVVFVKENTA
jgi:hypothetical protein